MGLALLVRYLDETGRNPEMLPGPCTQRSRRGYRLDAWIRITDAAGPLLYQVEVKTWSSHSIGGARLSVEAPRDVIRAYKVAQWNGYFQPDRGFAEKTLQKVFEKMTPPQPDVPAEPLACLWTAVHDQGDDEPFFRIQIAAPWSCFNAINVFSMSAYLRALSDARIELHLPDTERRLEYLSSLFPEYPLQEIVCGTGPGVATHSAVHGTASID